MAVIEENIDEIVAKCCGLTARQHETVKQRCEEFPLSVTVGSPRYVWSEDRKFQAQRYYEDKARFG